MRRGNSGGIIPFGSFALIDEVIDSIQSEKADEDQVDCHCEAHDPGRDHQKHSRDQGSDRQ